jgi:hypothetical protein
MYNKNIIELFCKIFHLLHGVTAHPVFKNIPIEQLSRSRPKIFRDCEFWFTRRHM